MKGRLLQEYKDRHDRETNVLNRRNDQQQVLKQLVTENKDLLPKTEDWLVSLTENF
jgi:hypothetical protein